MYYVYTEKMNIQNEYLDTQLCDKHLIYLVAISKYSDVIFEISILNYFNTSDSKKLNIQILQFNIYILELNI